MIGLNIKLSDGDVIAYLEQHELVDDVNALEDVVLIAGGTTDGRPAVLLVGTIDGKKRVLKTTLRLLYNAVQALNARTEQELGPDWRGP